MCQVANKHICYGEARFRGRPSLAPLARASAEDTLTCCGQFITRNIKDIMLHNLPGDATVGLAAFAERSFHRAPRWGEKKGTILQNSNL